MQLHRQAGFTTTGTWKGSVTVGSTTESISYYGSIGSSWVTVKTITATVNHSADGSGSCYIYSKVNGPGATSMDGEYVSGSETITLEKIARYASALSMAAFTDEENPVVKYTNPAGSAVQTLEAALSVDGTKATVAYRSISKTGSSYTFSLTTAERNALLSASANSKTLKVYVLIRSAISDVANVDKLAATMTVVNAKPKLSPEIVDTNSATIALTGNSAILVALHSVAKVTVNASAQKYATIKSVRVEHGTKVLDGDGTLNVTNDPIKITVTDSRGNTTTYTAGNTIIPYIDPTCVIGNAIPDGTGKLDLSVTGLVYDGSIGKTENAFTIQYRYKEGSGSYTAWTTFPSAVLSGNSYTATAAVSGLNYQSAYTFQARVIDSVNTSGITSATKKFKAVPVFNWGENNFNFNVPVTMSDHQIKNVAEPTDSSDAATKSYTDSNFLKNKGTQTLDGNLIVEGNGSANQYWAIDSTDDYPRLVLRDADGNNIARMHAAVSSKDYRNSRAVHAIANIERVYDERLQKHDFL